MRKYLLTIFVLLFIGCISRNYIIDSDSNILKIYNMPYFKLSSDGSNQLLDTLKLTLYRLSNDTICQNPFSPTTMFMFSVPSYSCVSYQIISLDSNIYSDIVKDSLNRGTYKLSLNGIISPEIFPSGIYYLKQTIDKVLKKRKFLIIR